VGVEDVRTDVADDRGHAPNGTGVVEQRDLALELRDVDDRDPETLGDERHRVLAAGEASGDEGGLVAPGLEPGREVRDVDRRPAHVQARDDAQDANGLVGSAHGASR
jgi:hypothetical protein